METVHFRDNKNRRSSRPKNRWTRNVLLLLLGGLAVIILLFAVLVITKNASDREYQAQVAAIRAQGAPTTLLEIEKWAPSHAPTPVPEPSGQVEKRDVDLYQQVAETLKNRESVQKKEGHDFSELLKRLQEGETLTPEEMEALRAYLAENSDILALLHEAAGLPSGKFPLDYSEGYNLELFHLARLRESGRLLQMEAMAAAVDGDPQKALNALIAGFALARPLRQEPILISQLVRAHIDYSWAYTLSGMLGRTSFNTTQLEEIRQLLDDARYPRALEDALMVERVFAMEMYDKPYQIYGTGTTWMDEIIPGSFQILMQTASGFGWFSGDRSLFMACMDDMIEGSAAPFPQADAVFREAAGRVNQNPVLPSLTSMMIPGLSRVPSIIARDEATLNQGVTATAIERYRIDHGTPPETLETLVPAYLDTVPQDPFDLQPMRYRPEGNGYVLYSVGANGRDERGVQATASTEGDIVFRVRR